MKRLSLLALAAALLVLGIVQPFSNASAQGVGPFYYLGEWEWTADESDPTLVYWAMPYPGVTGVIDMRNLPQMGTPGKELGERQCCAVLVTETPIDSRDTTVTALGGKRDITATLELLTRLGIPDATLTATATQDVIHELLTRHGDPTGETRWKPPLPDNRGRVRIRLGPGDWFSTEYARADDGTGQPDPLFPIVIQVLQHDYDRIRAESVARGDETHLKVAGYWQLKYGVDVRTVEQQADGIRAPATTIGDTFVEDGANVDLNAHTATGPSGGFSWTAVFGTITVVAADDQIGSGNNVNNNYRAESDLSSDDQDVEVDVIDNGGSVDNHGPAARFAAAAESFYTVLSRDSATNTFRLFKWTTGTASQIGSSINTTAPTPPFNLRLRVDGSSLEAFVDDGSVIGPETDMSFTGQTRTGVVMQDTVRLDNFEAADLAAEPADRRIIVISGQALWPLILIAVGRPRRERVKS